MYSDLLGVKFLVHGRSKKEGFDCYGLAMEVLKRNGVFLPDIPYDNFNQRDEVRENIFNSVTYTKVAKPVLNCIIEIKIKGQPLHVGVYIGEGLFIHSTMDRGVVIEPLHLVARKVEGYYKVTNNLIQKSV